MKNSVVLMLYGARKRSVVFGLAPVLAAAFLSLSPLRAAANVCCDCPASCTPPDAQFRCPAGCERVLHATCDPETGQCVGPTPTPAPDPVCGDGVVDPGEECDTGGVGDNCSDDNQLLGCCEDGTGSLDGENLSGEAVRDLLDCRTATLNHLAGCSTALAKAVGQLGNQLARAETALDEGKSAKAGRIFRGVMSKVDRLRKRTLQKPGVANPCDPVMDYLDTNLANTEELVCGIEAVNFLQDKSKKPKDPQADKIRETKEKLEADGYAGVTTECEGKPSDKKKNVIGRQLGPGPFAGLASRRTYTINRSGEVERKVDEAWNGGFTKTTVTEVYENIIVPGVAGAPDQHVKETRRTVITITTIPGTPGTGTRVETVEHTDEAGTTTQVGTPKESTTTDGGKTWTPKE